jgi:manganese oxidase
VVKVRQGLARHDYEDPGWYQHPAGTVAYEWKGDPPPASRKPQAAQQGPALKARKPGAGSHGH